MQPFRIGILLLLVALLGACSTVRLTYDNADWLLARMAASYVDLDRDQARALKTELAQFHDWHRREELPRYAELLEEAARRLERGLTPQDARWAVESVRARSRVLSRRAAAEMAPLLLTLNASQLEALEVRFAKANRKFYASRLPEDAEAAVAARADWLCDRFAQWTGNLSPEQRQRVTRLVRAFPEVPAVRLANREHRQDELLRLLRHRDDPLAQQRLFAFLSDFEASRTDRYRDTMAAWEAGFIELLVELDRSLTPRQRATAVERLRDYAGQFRALSSEALAAAG